MNILLDLLFPKKCSGCGKIDTYFCSGCILNILQKDLICPECLDLALGGRTHAPCRKKYGLDGLWSLGWYQGALKKALKDFKYKRVKGISETLAALLMQYFQKYRPLFFENIEKNKGKWAVVPVPLHWFRENSRGFNQSEEIGQILSRELKIAYSEALKRIRYTKPQVVLKSYGRCQNIKNAFVLSPDYQLQTTNCLLIDDVWTTGATLKECCRVLKQAGAKQVWAITLAR